MHRANKTQSTIDVIKQNGMQAMKSFLHVGCGAARHQDTPLGREAADWHETRMDVDPTVQPDILGSMTNMSNILAQKFDAIYSSHSIEHLYAHEVPIALEEFKRVLKPNGFALITCPDLQSIAAEIAQGRLNATAYQSAMGPISAHDMVFGFGGALAQGQMFMAHRCGFTKESLVEALEKAGFASVGSARRGAPYFDLWAIAFLEPQYHDHVRTTASRYFPQE